MGAADGAADRTDYCRAVRTGRADAFCSGFGGRGWGESEYNAEAQTNRTAGRVVTEDMERIEQMRRETAGKQVQEFIQKMRNLGLSSGDIMEAVEKQIKKEG